MNKSDLVKDCGRIAPESLFNLRKLDGLLPPSSQPQSTTIGLLFIQGIWNDERRVCMQALKPYMHSLILSSTRGLVVKRFVGSVLVDEDNADMLIGDNSQQSAAENIPLPPSQLPVFAVVIQTASMSSSSLRYLPNTYALKWETKAPPIYVSKTLKSALDAAAAEYHLAVDPNACNSALRIFVAGDRSSVGKSSMCLGILGSLLKMGYAPDKLAYIKPATQSESTQLVQVYCDSLGIACVPIGPLVYYRGFTRAFLAGETESTGVLLEKVSRAVDRVAIAKDIVLVDGVGFPAVGSICGTDNACVARASGYPRVPCSISDNRAPMGVLLVGGGGVGAAVDAFNLNATYFRHARIPVLGAIFNKLAIDGFYSLENCKKQIATYFAHQGGSESGQPFGFVPLFSKIADSDAMDHVEAFLSMFSEHVDVNGVLEAARSIQDRIGMEDEINDASALLCPKAKRKKVEHINIEMDRVRDLIEHQAIAAGAAPSA